MSDKGQNVVILRDWYLIGWFPDCPQDNSVRVRGEVYNHPNHKDGKDVVTSRIVDLLSSLDKRYMITKSGTFYLLEEPDKEFLDWITEKGYYLDSRSIFPIKNEND